MSAEVFDRDGSMLAVEVFGEIVILDLAPGDSTRAPFAETCDGCDGTGHLGRRVPPACGPCESCYGTGRVFFAFHAGDPFLTSAVPAAVAAQIYAEQEGAEQDERFLCFGEEVS